MNYDHNYHAGNFADVFKHVVILAMLRYLQRKESPYCYVETHAGYPFYDLRNSQAAKTGEAQGGIQKVWTTSWTDPLMLDYLALIKQASTLNRGQQCVIYPGSGAIAAEVMRHQDRVILQELALTPFVPLERFFEKRPRVTCYQHDGYMGSKAFLPPLERRGLVLIDPPYEEVHEWRQIKQYLAMALKRWPTGIFALWYPIKDRASLERNFKQLLNGLDHASVRLECCPWQDDVPNRLNGTGMCIFNPTWGLEQQIAPLAQRLAKVFYE